MIESLFKGKSQKTTRERETKRRDGQLPTGTSKLNGLLRYQLKRYTLHELGYKSGGTA